MNIEQMNDFEENCTQEGMEKVSVQTEILPIKHLNDLKEVELSIRGLPTKG